MKTFVALALAGSVLARPQGVTSAIAPEASAPAGCSDSSDSKFQISVVNVTSSASKRGVQRRQANILTVSLSGGVLTDASDRTGYIADNYQYVQFLLDHNAIADIGHLGSSSTRRLKPELSSHLAFHCARTSLLPLADHPSSTNATPAASTTCMTGIGLISVALST